ncbi:uncharacterized protein LOC130712585 [Lotus japonicus]|uniref:uncharacterized protein LOC130712585 n=1 Tax=Lotus japonicus TaxID=34305 RepID=UPI00259069D8|nr:uncharacterized protein LOC130712585 [Lotus japonicus]
MGVSNYYKILKVNLNATCERARKGFKRLAMLWNSDKNINQQLCDPTMIEEAEVKIEQIPEAYGYEMLCDPKKRVICDFRRSRNPVVVVEYNLECTLEQLYNGCRRKVKIKNVVPDQLFR